MKNLKVVIMLALLPLGFPFFVLGFIKEFIFDAFRGGKRSKDDLYEWIDSSF